MRYGDESTHFGRENTAWSERAARIDEQLSMLWRLIRRAGVKSQCARVQALPGRLARILWKSLE